jgi:iron(III) transport system substrate-binding protein
MLRHVILLLAAAAVISLPFIFRAPTAQSDWRPGDPVLVAVSPHNEAIRHEFARAFSRWHRDRHGAPVRVDWRAIGGTSEIARYLVAEYVNAYRAWWRSAGRAWPQGAGEAVVDRRLPSLAHADDPAARARWDRFRELHEAFRGVDDASEVRLRH